MDKELCQRRGSAYVIRVRGVLGSEWSAWFDGLDVLPGPGCDTLLVGPIRDQAALHGILAKVRDVGLPIVSVTSSANPDEEEDDEC